MRVGSDCAKKARAQQLWREYEALAFHDGEAVEDFTLWMQSLVSQLAALGIALSDKEVVAKYLTVVPAKYAQITLSIETLIDLSTLSRGRDKALEGGPGPHREDNDDSQRQAATDRGEVGNSHAQAAVRGRLLQVIQPRQRRKAP
jgi:hypothetical protein